MIRHRPMSSARATAARTATRRAAAGAAALALVLAACGDDGNDDGATATADQPTEPTSGSTTAGSGPAGTVTTEPATTEPMATTGSSPSSTPTGSSSPTGSSAPAAADDGPLCADLATSGPGSRESVGEQDAAAAIAEIESLSTFASAVSQSNTVMSRLEGQRPVTVFAPVDEAFEAVPDLDTVLADPDQLDDVLRQHVVAGIHTSDLLSATAALQSLANTPLEFSADGGTLMINGQVMVGCADIETSNGVIHLVDAVITPPAGETTPTTAAG